MIMGNITNKLTGFFQARLGERTELKKVIRNTGWLIGDNVARLILGAAVGVWMARYFGPTQYGIFNYGLAYVALFSSLMSLGLDNIVIREIVKDKAATNRILGSTFFLKIFAGVATFAVIVASVVLTKSMDSLTKGIIIILASSYIFYAFDTIGFWFQSEIKSKFVIYSKLGSFVFISLLRIFFLVAGAKLVTFAWLALAEIALGEIGLVLVYFLNKQQISKWQVSFAQMKKLLTDSWPLVFSGIAVIIYMKIDQIMIGNMLGAAEVGIYSVAVKLSEIWYFVPMAIGSSVFPSIVALRKISKELYLSRMQSFYDIMIWMAILIAAPVAFFSKDIIAFVYGSQYVGAGPVLAIYIWAGVAIFLGVASEQYLLAENYIKISFVRALIGGISNVVLNFYLIPKYGIIGSAWATLISYTISTFSLVFFRQTSGNFVMFLKTLNILRLFRTGISIIKNKD